MAADRCRHVWLVKQMNLDIDVSQLMDFVNKGVGLVLGFKSPAQMPFDQALPHAVKLESLGSGLLGSTSSQLPSQPSSDQQQSAEPRLISIGVQFRQGSASGQGDGSSMQPFSINDSKQVIAEDENGAVSGMVLAEGLGNTAHRAVVRKPLGHRHGPAAQSASGFKAHKRRLVRQA